MRTFELRGSDRAEGGTIWTLTEREPGEDAEVVATSASSLTAIEATEWADRMISQYTELDWQATGPGGVFARSWRASISDPWDED